jgi:flagellar protein FliS
MTRNQTELTYLRAAVESASAAGLVIVLYDMLIGDLRVAIAAIANRNVEERSKQLKHAFLVLERLEQGLDMENGGEAAVNLSRFYSTLRAAIMRAHAEASADILTHQIELLFQVRGAWAQVDKPPAPSPAPQTSYARAEQADSAEPSAELAMSWNA